MSTDPWPLGLTPAQHAALFRQAKAHAQTLRAQARAAAWCALAAGLRRLRPAAAGRSPIPDTSTPETRACPR